MKGLEKKTFPQTIPLEARIAVVATIMRNFRRKSFFLVKGRRRLKPCAKFQTIFLLKIFQRFVVCSFDNPGQKFRKIWKKKVADEFFFSKTDVFFLRERFFFNLFLWQFIAVSKKPEENFPPMSHNLIFILKIV